MTGWFSIPWQAVRNLCLRQKCHLVTQCDVSYKLLLPRRHRPVQFWHEDLHFLPDGTTALMHPHPGSSSLGLALRFTTNPKVPMLVPVVLRAAFWSCATPSCFFPFLLFVHFPLLLSLLLLRLAIAPCIAPVFHLFLIHFRLKFLLVFLLSCVKSSLGPIPDLPLGPTPLLLCIMVKVQVIPVFIETEAKGEVKR